MTPIIVLLGCILALLFWIGQKQRTGQNLKRFKFYLPNSSLKPQITHEQCTNHIVTLDLTCKGMTFKVTFEPSGPDQFRAWYFLISPTLPQWFALNMDDVPGHYKLDVGAYSSSFDQQNLPEYSGALQGFNEITKNLNDLMWLCTFHISSNICCLSDIIFAKSNNSSSSAQHVSAEDYSVELFEKFVNVCDILLKQTPKDPETYCINLLKQEDILHPTFSMSLKFMLDQHAHEPIVSDSFDRLFKTVPPFSKMPDEVILDIIKTNKTSLKLLEDKHIEPLQLLSLITLCGDDDQNAPFRRYFKARCADQLTAQHIELMGPEHIGARHDVIDISVGYSRADQLEMIAKCSLKWLSWIKDRPDVWVFTLVEYMPQHCKPNFFLKPLSDQSNNLHLPWLCMAFMALIEPSPDLLTQAEWAKVSAFLLPDMPTSSTQSLLNMINIYAHPSIYLTIAKEYDKSVPALKQRFEKLKISGGLSLAPSDNAGALSMNQDAGAISMTDDQSK